MIKGKIPATEHSGQASFNGVKVEKAVCGEEKEKG